VTLLPGARDVFLEELIGLAEEDGDAEALYQAAVSNVPVSPVGLAHMIAGEPAEAAPAAAVLKRLARRSLVYLDSEGNGLVHRNFLTGEDFDAAANWTHKCLQALAIQNQSVQVATLASEELESLPLEHEAYSLIADAEANAFLALGFIRFAFDRYSIVQVKYERLIQDEPDRADNQRDLWISYRRMGGLGGSESLNYYQRSRTILLAMKSSDRHQPVDEPYIEQLEAVIREAQGQG
jgi:hypothetical protein